MMTYSLWFLGSLMLLDAFLRFALLCVRFLARAPQPSKDRAGSNECVILIPAKDEEGTIGSTVAALRQQISDDRITSLWVISDHCRDGTAAEAEACGARVAIRTEGPSGKGAAIAWWLRNHRDAWQDQSTIVLLDADTRLIPGSIPALIQAMDKDTLAAQAFVAPAASTSAGRLAGDSEVLMQLIDDEARRRCGWPVPLRGTGMAFQGKLLAELAPSLHTLAEDLELNVLAAAAGITVKSVPDAVVFDPKPSKLAWASRQRGRWLRGQLQVLWDYRQELTHAFIHGSLGTRQLLLMLILRPKIAFIAMRIALLLGAWQLAMTGLVMDAAYYLAALFVVENRKQYLSDLLGVPRYALMWLWGFNIAATRRDWSRTGR
jgi:cellulose synthase/poly-beta-1,6-N-acetylglucosamine synthase-like glycosyltransferase